MILESAGGPSLGAALALAAPGGQVVSYGNSSRTGTSFLVDDFYPNQAVLRGFYLLADRRLRPVGADLRLLGELAVSGRLPVEVVEETGWDEAGSVLGRLRDRAIAGKAVLRLGDAGITDATLDEAHREVRAKVRRVAETVIEPGAAVADAEGKFPEASHRALVAEGLYAPHVPEAYGGQGADALTSCLIVEEVARVCASSSLTPNVTRLASLPLLLSGSVELCERYLRPVREGAILAFALSEPEAGSDAASLRTRAVREGDGYRLDGEKRWITNAGVADYYVVAAVTEPDAGGISLFVVHSTDEGLSVGPGEDKLGMRGSPTCPVYLRGVHVPADRLVGAEGQGLRLALGALDHSRITIAAQAVGIAQGALDHAAAYLTARRQFGRPLADFQGLRFKLADMAMTLEAARQLTYAAAARSALDSADLRFFSAAAKCFASDTAMRVTVDAVQLLGGHGYTRNSPLERMMRDAKVTQIYEGTNEILRTVVAKQVLTDHG
ncbi:acyl-CoA dehydrogenase family protein [Amycolatopsis sp. H20-H5]|uniref:acyl-CoA dehydrogenase family protein n=1 Tax=Amycolatopsis sp. H20-H5 TaxID=3046309 RepID=UPI002DB64AEC|nr:acyl-CoA dehydrogenase family protein [Amycolatopsis sp. H20-H5]MEC3980524.1 acyl-CoA dehydrogenase family protein [Amycolatopsis sp. H20-H5]